MFRLSVRRATVATAVLIVVLAASSAPVRAAEPAGAWTLDQAREHLRLYPHDTYVKYVALQLARREGKVSEVAMAIGDRQSNWSVQQRRRDDVNLFSIFSGALAVQESLQLDAMLADQTPGPSGAAPAPEGRQGPRPLEEVTVAMKDLVGPSIKSHPWDQMLAGRKPQVSLLALSVPDDFYFAEFRSVNKLTEASKIADLWSTHLFNQSVQEAETQLVDQRMREQLAVEVNPLLAPFYDSIVKRVAIAGSDLFVREGSDVTLLFQASQPAVFRVQMEKFLVDAAAKPDAKRSSGTYRDVTFDSVETPDRRIRVFSAYPKPELHVRSNSRKALERIIDAILGKTADGKPVRRLGDASEFTYIRTLLPPGAPEEDGLIYLSDPFMRHMVGPKLRLTERRRMVCYNNLKMISHAALMYRTEHGKDAKTLAELATANCVPGEFGTGKLACPDGGTYTLAADGLTGVCSHHGYSSYLTPCSEIDVLKITEPEAKAYRDFVEQYNNYWRIYFDPIAVRLTISPERYRAETIVLPLIDNTVYSALSTALAGKPEQLDALPVPNRNIFTLAVRLDKRAILRQMQLESLINESDPAADELPQAVKDTKQVVDSLRQLAIATLNYHDTRKVYPANRRIGREGKPLLSWRVELLPFLEENELYNQFHRDEPWDSEHNKKLISRIPKVFRPASAKLAATGKTKFVVPRGKGALYPLDDANVMMRNIADGTSQTIHIVEVDDDHAVVWSKPDDLAYDPERPSQGLDSRSGSGYLMSCCDGSIHKLDPKIGNASLATAFSRAAGDLPNWHQSDEPLPIARANDTFMDMPLEFVQQLRLGELVSKGIGNQVSFNVYDAQQLFDLSLPKALGMMLGSFRGGMARDINSSFLSIAFLLGSLNSPVYIAIPVKNREIVDQFLKRLDGFLVGLSHEREGGFFELERDYYQIPTSGSPIRTGSIGFGPVKWRFFFQRIDDAVYVASQRTIVEDLAAIKSKGGPAPTSNDRPAHALVRLRPQHWNQVLDHYHLGWEESNRQACLKNLGPLTSLSRALTAGNSDGKPLTTGKLADYTARLYDVRYFCPDDGQYTIGGDGAITCNKHGSANAPRQAASPAASSELGKLLGEFSDMWLSLTFLDDGLHAVVDLERKK